MKEMMDVLESEEQFYELIQEDKTHVFVFSADWCPDCVYIKPFLPELIKKYSQYVFVYVDRDAYIDLCIDHEIMGILSFVVYRQGKEIGRFVSKLRKTKEQIDDFLSSMLEK